MPLLAGAVLAGAPGASATHSDFPTCDPTASTRLFTGTVLGLGQYLWIQQVTPTQTRFCFGTYPDRVTLVINTGVSITTPTVVQTPGTGSCATEVFDIQDPVDAQLSVGFSGAPTFCWGVNDATTTISLTGVSVNAVPYVQVWRPGGGLLATAFCLDEYALWQAAGGASGTSEHSVYTHCTQYAARIP